VTAAELLQRLIRFDTTNPPGNEADCAAFLRGLLAEAGIDSQTYEAAPGRPNLVARLAGRGEAPPLLLQGHVDVVTTADQAWSRPPFDGVLEDGWIWGRGALDMKGGVAMMVTAFLRARREAAELPGDVLLVVLADEEAGSDLGARFLVEQHPGLFDGVRYALGEFGGASIDVGGRTFYPIQVAEKEICWLRATLRGPGGHAALPNRGGTMARLARFLRDLDRRALPVHVTPVVRTFFETIAAHTPRPHSLAFRSLLQPALADGALRLLGERGRPLEAMLRNTVTATIVGGGEKINVVPSRVVLELDGRALPSFSPDDVIRELRHVVGSDVELELLRHDPGPPDADLALLDTLGGILRELDPAGTPVPMLQPGVTDARYFSRLGIQTYGFLPLRLPADFVYTSSIHAADERVPADAVDFGAEAVFRALQRFGRA
jgi:acetylornithine deacetylase/succinyl-diaminopimelate desuccinylase-like protein